MATKNLCSIQSGNHTYVLVDNASEKTYDNYATQDRFTMTRDGVAFGKRDRSLRGAMKTFAHVIEKAPIVAGIGAQARKSPTGTNTA